MLALDVDHFSGGISNNDSSCIVDDIIFSQKAGEFVGIVGPSGSGKSTLLKLLLGVLSGCRGGSIQWSNEGQILTGLELHKRVKFVPLKEFVDPELSIEEALTNQIILREGKKHVSSKLTFYLDTFGLQGCRKQRIGNLASHQVSSGQRRRLSLALEFIGCPPALVLDEPTSGVDSECAKVITNHLKLLASEHRCLILAVIHQPSPYVFEQLDKVLVLSGGKQAFYGPPLAAYSHFQRLQSLHDIKFDFQTKPTPLETIFLVAYELQKERTPKRSNLLDSDQESTSPSTTKSELVLIKEATDDVDSHSSTPSRLSENAGVAAHSISNSTLRHRGDLSSEHQSISLDEEDSSHRGAPGKSQKGAAKRACPWYLEMYILLKVQILSRIRETGYLRSVSITFLVMAFILGAIYWKVMARIDELHTLPMHPVLPDQDIAMMGLDPAKFAFDLPRTGYIGNLPANVVQYTQIVLSMLLYGLDGQGDYTYLDPLYNGIDGNGSLPFPNLASIASVLYNIVPCLHSSLGLPQEYPEVTLNDSTLDPMGDRYVNDGLEFLLKGYQLIDWIVYHDWTPCIECLMQTNMALLQYTCILSTETMIDVACKCMGLPEIPFGFLAAYASDPSQGASLIREFEHIEGVDLGATWDALNKKLTRLTSFDVKEVLSLFKPVTTIHEQHISNDQIHTSPKRMLYHLEYSWEMFEQLMPVGLSFASLVGRVLSPNQDPKLIDLAYNKLWDNLFKLVDKLSPEGGCTLKICEHVEVVPTLMLAIFIDALQHAWTTVNICGLLFVLSAVTGCWAIESSLTFGQAREKMNKDCFNLTYGRIKYLLCRMLTDLVFQWIPIIVLSLIVFYMAQLRDGSFGSFLLVLLLISFSAAGVCSFFSIVASTVPVSLTLSSIVLTLMLLLSGFVLRSARETNWYQGLGYISVFRSGYAGLVLTQFTPDQRFGIFTQWAAADFFGGVEIAKFSYLSCCMTLLIQGLAWRLLTLISASIFHTKLGLKNT